MFVGSFTLRSFFFFSATANSHIYKYNFTNTYTADYVLVCVCVCVYNIHIYVLCGESTGNFISTGQPERVYACEGMTQTSLKRNSISRFATLVRSQNPEPTNIYIYVCINPYRIYWERDSACARRLRQPFVPARTENRKKYFEKTNGKCLDGSNRTRLVRSDWFLTRGKRAKIFAAPSDAPQSLQTVKTDTENYTTASSNTKCPSADVVRTLLYEGKNSFETTSRILHEKR